MKFSCSECGARIEATERFFGRDVGCPNCGNQIHVPKPEENTGISIPVTPVAPKATPEPEADATSKPAVSPSPAKRPVDPGQMVGNETPVKSGKKGFGAFLLLLVCLTAGGGGWYWYKDQVAPRAIQPSLAQVPQAAEPTPTPTPAPMASPVLAAEPSSGVVPRPEATPETSVESVPASTPVAEATSTPGVTPEAAVAMATPVSTLPPPKATPTPRRRIVSYFGSSEPTGPEDETPEPPAATATPTPAAPFPATGLTYSANVGILAQPLEALANRRVILSGAGALRLTKAGDPLSGSVVNFLSPDAWLMLDKVPAATAEALLPRLWINGVPASVGTNVRVVQYGVGSAVIPQGPDYTAMQVFGGPSLSGASLPLRCGAKYNAESLNGSGVGVASFRLKRGYMATLAQEENGTGFSRNYVAQDRDLEVKQLPQELSRKVKFVRVFPWRWTSKKGVAGDIHQNLNVGWYYNWNISAQSTAALEYVPIRQNRWWPGLNQDWLARGATHLLGFNEPDHTDQSNLKVDDAIRAWPDLLGTGLRLGSPAVSDGGLNWLYDFMQKADAARLRVDFVAVHYYRAVGDPNDAKGAATQMYNFLKGIHERTKRPLWVTEWNNGANWTGHKPNYQQEKAAVAAMVEMLDRAPFVERYAIYNWVEDERNVQRKDGSLTPAGEIYRDAASPVSYSQPAQ